MTKSGYADTATAELYDPATGIWSRTASVQVSRLEHTATLLNNGQVLVAAGRNDNGNTGLTSAELSTP
jgi:hypothetical protein